MKTRGRPPLKQSSVEVHVHLRLQIGEDDDDLIQYFYELPNRRRAATLKMALRAGGMQNKESTSEVDDNLADDLSNLLF